MGLIWLKHPVLWHSSRVPSGYDYTMMTDEQKTMIVTKWHNWYSADWEYGQTTLAFFCAGIATVFLFKVVAHLRGRKFTVLQGDLSVTHQPGTLDRVIAACRYATARQFHVRTLHWYSPPLAAVVAVCGMFTFLMALMLAVRPYYWPNDAMGHSPPIATRAGWISIAIMPFMIVFATKVNFIGILTGTSHEKLQVFHRWTAFFMYITSLVHTFPFIINSIRMREMEAMWSTSPWYWTGVAALVPQTYLVALSWGIFRNPYYEIFKKLHFIAAGIFMAALFIHVNFRLTSWDYFWAVVGLYGTSWLMRVLRTHYNSGVGLPATIEYLPGNMIKVRVEAPKRLRWSPGQHVFVRFVDLGIHFFSSHPFTVASIPADGHSLDLVLRVKKGITQKLANVATGKAARSTRVLIDGPYGGLPFDLKNFHTVYLFAGGSGASFTVPLLLDLARKFESKDHFTCTRVEFVLAVKDKDSAAWLSQDLILARKCIGDERLNVRIHITEAELTGDAASSSDDVKTIEDASATVLGRPNLPQIVRQASKASQGKVAIVACGPESLLYDVRNAVSECQLIIADGYGTCKDIYLHTENFG
ncbi:hypothetical protein BDZ89DRAFT_940671 [Hymenopellis radicata]|nr:hypothetical protein BDZ89DRAFT_940671 [Hymenopellis radicata]